MWQRYDEMVDAWSAEPNTRDTDAKKEGAKALKEVADNFFDAYISVAGAHDVIPYMHHVNKMLSIYTCRMYSFLAVYTLYNIARHS